MSTSALHTTISQVIDKHGQDIISDLRLMYILSDYGAFDRLSDEHDIVKDLQNKGYGQLLLDSKRNNDSDWQSRANVFINDFLSSHASYDGAEVLYICDAIAFGAGLLPEKSIRKQGGATKPSYSSDYIDFASELKKLQSEYLSMLKSSLVVPDGKLFRRPSGYFPIDAQNNLYLLEKKIWLLGHELGQDLTSWCNTEKQRVLDANTHPVKTQRLGLMSLIAVPSVFAIVLLSILLSYLGAKGSVSAFKQGITNANNLYESGDYAAAIEAYNLTGDSYKESYKKHSFKGKVKSGIQKASVSLVSSCLRDVQSLYNRGDYYEALMILNSLPDGIDCSSDKSIEKKLVDMRKEVTSTCEILLSSEIDNLITSISRRKGKPSAEDLVRIDYLLSIDPSNYWLNFIKNKTKE